MALLLAGNDITVIALWLGYESVATAQVYLHADMTLKEQALADVAPDEQASRPIRGPHTLLAFLDGL